MSWLSCNDMVLYYSLVQSGTSCKAEYHDLPKLQCGLESAEMEYKANGMTSTAVPIDNE